jgi:NitT/TauT family transport system substrate-binding protein
MQAVGTAVQPTGTRRCFLGAMGGAVVSVLAGCSPLAQEPIRVGAHVWPGYELVYLARHLGMLNAQQVRLIETPSATASLRSFSSGSMEAACLTLDEVLTAREDGIDLSVVAVLDVSMGADVLIAHPELGSLEQLRGKRIGVEQTAVGAVMLDAVLQRARLTLADVEVRYTTVDGHEAAFDSGAVDALITYEPTKSRLQQAGAVALFSSADVPGLVVDVLAVRTDVLRRRADAVRHLVQAHFQARQAWHDQPDVHAAFLSQRLGLPPEEVPAAFADLELPDRVANRTLLQGESPFLLATVMQLGAVMQKAGLLKQPPLLDGLLRGDLL